MVPQAHKAVRGYKTWRDSLTGRDYSTANNAKVEDEGLRVLSVKHGGGTKPMLIRTRKAKVKRPLMSVADLVDANKTVVFDSAGAFAVDKTTGLRQEFQRKGKGWNVTFDLQAPDDANRSMSELQDLKKAESQKRAPIQIYIGDKTSQQVTKVEEQSAQSASAVSPAVPDWSGPFGRPGFRRL